MLTRELMSEEIACCTPETSLVDVAKLMAERDCGCIPVVESQQSKRLAGVITDRDIVVRAVANNRDPSTATAGDFMSRPVFTATPETSEEELCHLMEQHQVRRVPVVDENSACCGIVSQADIARVAPEAETAEVLRDISQPSGAAGL